MPEILAWIDACDGVALSNRIPGTGDSSAFLLHHYIIISCARHKILSRPLFGCGSNLIFCACDGKSFACVVVWASAQSKRNLEVVGFRGI